MNFSERIKKSIAGSYENASNVLSEAADKVKEMGQKGKLQFEINQIEKEVENKMPLLGSEVYSLYRSGRLKVMNSAEEVEKLLTEIKDKENLITEKEYQLEDIQKKEKINQ